MSFALSPALCHAYAKVLLLAQEPPTSSCMFFTEASGKGNSVPGTTPACFRGTGGCPSRRCVGVDRQPRATSTSLGATCRPLEAFLAAVGGGCTHGFCCFGLSQSYIVRRLSILTGCRLIGYMQSAGQSWLHQTVLAAVVFQANDAAVCTLQKSWLWAAQTESMPQLAPAQILR